MNEVIRNGKVFKLDADRCKVSYLYKTDEGMVRKVMSLSSAIDLMSQNHLTESSDPADYPIAVDGKYFFPGAVTEEGK